MDSAELNLMRFRAKELNKLLVAPPKTNLEVKTEDPLESYKDAWAYKDSPESTNTSISINLDSPSQEVKVESRIDSIRLQLLKEEVIALLTDDLTPYKTLSNTVAEDLWSEFCRRHHNPLRYTKGAICQECFSYIHPTDGYETAEAFDHRESIERNIAVTRSSDNCHLCPWLMLFILGAILMMFLSLS